MLTAEVIRQAAQAAGADIVGIGAMERFEGAPLQNDPRYIFPEAQTIIGLGFRIHRGLLRGIEEGTFFAAYPSMGYANINDVYAPIVMRELGDLLEDNGYEAVLYQNTAIRMGCGVGEPVREGYPRPDVFLHFRIAAYVCGMGEIGWSKVFLTPRFGPRQRFAFIITDAPLDPDPLVEPGTLCDRCMLCVSQCPGKAISGDASVKCTVAGMDLEWGELDEQRCAAVYQVGTPEYSPFLPEHVAEYVDTLISEPKGQGRSEMLSYGGGAFSFARNEVPYSSKAWESWHHPSAIDGARGCMRACMMHLEERGVIENQFHNKFRIRKPWRLDRGAE